ncbi:MAG: VWA domain-containing protein [Proteobacteria bacterium]|nr:VWA domain-containing protein [Pseudomonadota bacterium]
MLRDVSDLDPETFAFGHGAEHAATTAVEVQQGPSGATATIADPHLLFNSEFVRAGNNLILRGHDGGSAFVRDYFALEHRATLVSHDGAKLSGDLVDALSGSVAPGQYAQAGTPAPAASDGVGRVVTSTGDASIIRNGAAVTLKAGDPVLRADVLQTQAGTMAVTFNDGSTLNLTANTRIVVSEFVYSPNGAGNSQLLNLVQGSLTFISGEVAHSGNMRIGTPVATMGIRGTVGGVTTANDGTVHFYVSQSATGAVIINEQGQIIANVVQDGPMIVVRPAGPLQVIAEEVQKSPAQLALELAALQQIVSIKAVGDQLLQQFFQQQNPNNPNPQSPQNGPHTQIQIDLHNNTNNANGDDPPPAGGKTFDQATIHLPPANTDGPSLPATVVDLLHANLPPITFAPLVATVQEDQTLTFGGAKAISVFDADTTVLTVTVTVTHGLLTLASVAGLSFATGNGANAASMTFSGTQTAINAALEGMTFKPSADYNGAAALTITTQDDVAHSVTTSVPIAVMAVNDAPVVTAATASVSEEGLSHGIPDTAGAGDTTNNTVAHGTITATDVDGDSLTYKLGLPDVALTSDHVAITWALGQDGKLTGSAGGNPVILVALDEHSGAYTVTLTGPIDHPDTATEDALSFDIPIVVNDGTATTSGTLAVTVEDDSPKAADIATSATAGAQTTSVNIVIALDISGSMSTLVDGTQLTRLDLAKAAISNLLTAQDVTINKVMAFGFSDHVESLTGEDNTYWVDAAQANGFIQGLGIGGGTNYSGAISSLMAHWGAGPSSADKTLIYFISDGVPTEGQALDDPGRVTTAQWEAFIAQSGVTVANAIGISTGVDNVALAPIAWSPENSSLPPIILQDATGLDDTLQGTVVTTHNIFSDSNAAVGFGADGGHIESVTVDGVTYTWNGHTGEGAAIHASGEQGQTICGTSLTVQTVIGGTLVFYFAAEPGHAAGDWTYTPPLAGSSDELLHYTLVDNDGDRSSADIRIDTGAPEFNATGLTTASPDNVHTLVAGLAVADSDAGSDLLTVSFAGQDGTLAFNGAVNGLDVTGSGTHTLTATGTLPAINTALGQGVVYTSEVPQPPTSTALATISDGHGGTDTVNFVFANGSANGPVTLSGTSGKDVIFSAGPDATLTGNGGSDTFVFSVDNGGTAHITDFNIADDFLQISHTIFASVDAVLAAAQGSGNTVISTAHQGSLVLDGIDATTFQTIDHSHIIIV